MDIKEFKGKPLGNSLSVYLFYKKQTGRALLSDLSKLLGAVNKKGIDVKKASDQETLELLEEADSVDITDIVTNIYVASRKSADPTLESESVIEIAKELDINDLAEVINIIADLLSSKKKS